MKAQLMTISVLVLFILMLAELIVFITLSTGYNSLSQTYAKQLSLSNYKAYLSSSSTSFAASALKSSLIDLAGYVSGSDNGGTNIDLISNSSLYLSQLIKNGTIPTMQMSITYNATGPGVNENGTLAISDPLTLNGFNASIESDPLYGVSNIIINETMPVVYQNSPYNISVKFTEYVELNASGTIYHYVVPVNATISLNGTPDLYYAQHGVVRYINFGNVANLAQNVGNTQALNGTTDLFAYGTTLNYGSNTVCPSNNALISSQIIFATDNAPDIGCNGSGFGGMISYYSPSASPANYVPYLNYPLSSNFIGNDLPTGTPVLLYGPSLSTLDISNLKTAVADHYYFASPFAPSYLDRAAGNFANSSVDGMFTFTGYSRKVAYLESNSYIDGSRVSALNLTNFEWVYPTSNQSFSPIAEFDGATADSGFYNISLSNGNIVVWNGNTKYVSSFQVPMYKWSFIGFSLNGTSIRVFYNGNSQLFSSLSNPSPSTLAKKWIIGAQLGATNYYSKMAISNVQLYGKVLTTQQAYKEYQDGMGSLPIAASNVMLWLQLNNNTLDYSGNGYYTYYIWSGSTLKSINTVSGHNGAAHSLYYGYPQNYNRGSIFIVPTAQPTYPLPGIMSCSNTQQCANATSPHLYMADLPLEYGSRLVASYNPSVSSMVVIQQLNGTPLTKSNSFTLSAWVYGYGPVTTGETIANSSNNNNDGGFDLLFSKLATGSADYIMSIAPCCTNRLDWPVTTTNFPLNTWDMITAEYNSSTGTSNVYVNGTLFQTENIGKGLTAGQLLPLYLGSNSVSGGPSSTFNGLMSDVQLYNQTLSQNQVQSLYSEGISGSPITGKMLVGWWPLNGNANDYSGNGNNGVSYNLTYVPFIGYSNAGSSTPTAISDEWQALGFGGAPKQSIFWNVTEWLPAGGSTDPLAYASVTTDPLLPSGVNVYTSNMSGWYGIPTYRNNANGLPGFTGWAYESSSVSNRQRILMNAVPFPVPFNGLNNYAACGVAGKGYTATANLTLSGTYTVNVETAGATQVFYRQAGSIIWNPVLPSGAWGANSDNTYSGSFTLTPGEYQFAVDYESTCGYGISAFSMSYG